MFYKSLINKFFLRTLRILIVTMCVAVFGQEQQNTQKIQSNYNLKIKVNDTLLTLQLDTGSAISILNEGIHNQKSDNLIKKMSTRKFTDALGNIVEKKIYNGLTFSFNETFNDNPNFIFQSLNLNTFLNCNNYTNDGILGLNFFLKHKPKPILIINHTSKRIGIAERKDINLKSYNKLSSDFRNNAIYIDIKVAGKKVEMIFDTGYNGYVLLIKKFRRLNNFNEVNLFENTSMGAFSLANNNEITFEGVPLELANVELPNTIVSVNKKGVVPLFGAKIIENFNWIIDFEKEEVYFQKRDDIKNNSISEKIKQNNVALAVNGKLLIVNSFQSDYKNGSIIDSVQNQKVTLDNICELQNLLNDNSQDWTTLKITIK